MKKIKSLAIITCLFLSNWMVGQEMMVNGGFETVINGPVTGSAQIEKAEGWTNISACINQPNPLGTPDLVSCQSTNPSTSVPNNAYTFYTGQDLYAVETTGPSCNYAHIIRNRGNQPFPMYNPDTDSYHTEPFTEVMEGTLEDPLQEGCYDFSLFAARGYDAWDTDNILEVYLTDGTCEGQSLLIWSSNVYYSIWTQFNANFSLTSAQSGIYTHIKFRMKNVMTQIGQNGIYQSVLIDAISLWRTPPVEITGDNAICTGESTTLTASGSGPYLWSTGETTQSITVNPTATTTYTITETVSSACSTTDNITVTVNPLPVVNIDDVTLCYGDNFPVVLASGSKKGRTFNWTYEGASMTGTSLVGTIIGNGHSANVNVEGTYCVTSTLNSTGCSATDCAEVKYDERVNNTPAFTIDQVSCRGGYITVTITAAQLNGYDNSSGTGNMATMYQLYEKDIVTGNFVYTGEHTWNTNIDPTAQGPIALGGVSQTFGFEFEMEEGKYYKIKRSIRTWPDTDDCLPWQSHMSDIITCTGTGRGQSHPVSSDGTEALSSILSAVEFNVYPNPTKGIFTIDLGTTEDGQIQVLDYTGRIVLEKAINDNSLQLDISEMPSGLYVVRVVSGGKLQTTKIIKE